VNSRCTQPIRQYFRAISRIEKAALARGWHSAREL